MSSFFKDILRVGSSNLIMIVCGLGTSIITARFLGPDKNGIIAALLVYPGLFMSVGSLGIRQSTAYYLGKGIFSEEDIKRAIAQIWAFTTIFSLMVCFILMRYFSNSGNNLLLVIIALLPLPFTLFNTYNAGIFLGKNDIANFNKVNWIPSVLLLIGTVGLVILLKLEIAGALIASFFGPLFISILLLFKNKFINSFGFNFNWTILKSLLSLGVVYALALFVINLNYRVDIILLDRLSSPYELGIYSKGASITQYLWQIPMILSTLVFARSAVAKDNLEFSLKVAQLLRVSFILVSLMSLFLAATSYYLIYFMYGESFLDSIKILQVLLPGVVILTIFKVMNMDLAGKGKPWISMKAMVPALLLNVVINLILIPRYGALGASISSTISYSLAGILFLIFYSRETNIPIRTIIGYKKTDFDPILNLLKKLKR